MDVEGPVVVEADSSERPDEFVLELDGTSEDALGECWWVCGGGRGFDESECIERVSRGVRTNYSGEELVQFLFFIWTVCFHYASEDGGAVLEDTGGGGFREKNSVRLGMRFVASTVIESSSSLD